MKKAVVFFCFLAGAICFISAGLYINKQQSGMTEEYVQDTVTKVASPELLSEINIPAYVSLPASFSDIDIQEGLDDIQVTESNVDNVMYDQLMSTANRLETVERDDEMIIVDYTIIKGNNVEEVKSNVNLGYNNNSNMYDENVYKALKGTKTGDSIHLEGVSFNGFNDVTVDLTITNILDMPYPVTDKYISKNTEYKNIYDMRTALMNDSSGKAKEVARKHTINTLIDTMLQQTTFIKLPESLIMKELEVLQKEDETATYDEAKDSLYKIFFITSVINQYDIATKTDIENRYAKLEDTEKDGLSQYEIERKKCLLFEEDVVTYIYKKVQINSEN